MPRTAVEPRNPKLRNIRNSATEKSIMPEIRFTRAADITPNVASSQWHNALAEFGKLNTGIGNVKSLGSVAITYVSAKEMGRMISKKYPTMFESSRKTEQYMRRMSEEYRNFVRNIGRDIIDTPFGPIEFGTPRWDDKEDDFTDFNDKRLWKLGNFATNELMIFGKNKLAFDMSNDEVQQVELEKTLSFIQSHNLDLDYIDRNRALHATILVTNCSTDLRQPKTPVEWPASMTFKAPSARVVT